MQRIISKYINSCEDNKLENGSTKSAKLKWVNCVRDGQWANKFSIILFNTLPLFSSLWLIRMSQEGNFFLFSRRFRYCALLFGICNIGPIHNFRRCWEGISESKFLSMFFKDSLERFGQRKCAILIIYLYLS